MAQILNRLKHSFSSARIVSFFQTDINDELLKRATTRLLVLNGEMVNIETEQSTELMDLSAKAIAQAAKKLLDNQKQISVALFLPATEFAWSSYNLSGVTSANVEAALGYQTTELFPAHHSELLLAVSHRDGEENKALWFSQRRAEELFLECNQLNIALTAILPTILFSVKNAKGPRSYREDTLDYQLLCSFVGNSLTEWQMVLKKDLQSDAFYQEWDNLVKRINPEEITLVSKQEKWSEQPLSSLRNTNYAFFPAMAKQRLQKQSRLKTGRFSSFIIIILLLLLSVPFVQNEMRYMREEKKYMEYKEHTKNIRKMKGYVLNQQEVWAPFQNFPNTNLVATLELLNKIIPKNSWLSSFNYKEGKIEIEGFSPNPGQLLQLISAQEQFESVEFNKKITTQQGKQNERFGITMRLKNLNPDEFKQDYFPQE